DFQQLASHFHILFVEGRRESISRLPISTAVFVQTGEARLIVMGKVVIDFGKLGFFANIFTKSLQVFQSCGEDGAPGVAFFGRMRTHRASQTERANQRRQGESLKHQRDQDGAEGEKNNHAALRERRASAKVWGRAIAAASEMTPRIP